MHSANEIAEVNQAQRTYARLAGLLLLAAIILALGSGAVLSKIAGNGSFAETATRIAASERSYRETRYLDSFGNLHYFFGQHVAGFVSPAHTKWDLVERTNIQNNCVDRQLAVP